MNEMAAKFAREAKEKPTDWQIYPIGNGLYRLVYLKRGKIMNAKMKGFLYCTGAGVIWMGMSFYFIWQWSAQ